MAERWESLTVDGSSMNTFLGVPEAAEPLPGVVVIMHGPGLDDFSVTMARRFNEAGYASVATESPRRRSRISWAAWDGCGMTASSAT